uniref:Putative secreted protein n=1 Tax=Amblyomma triste TaxID=251400 RepID=A0A023G0C9_AMBTT
MQMWKARSGVIPLACDCTVTCILLRVAHTLHTIPRRRAMCVDSSSSLPARVYTPENKGLSHIPPTRSCASCIHLIPVNFLILSVHLNFCCTLLGLPFLR